MAVPWGPIISAGATLLGSIFGGGKRSTTTTSRVDYARMVRDAEAAGFNPLTALRNGGSAGFAVTTSSTPAAPLSARIADGVASGVNKFLETYDPHADAAREKGFALIDAQVRNLNAQSGAIFPAMPGGFHMPGTYGGTFEGRPSGKAGALSAITGAPQVPELGTVTVTNPHKSARVDPSILDAEAFEARYGDSELGQMGYGAYVGYHDLRANYPKSPTLDLMEMSARGWGSFMDAVLAPQDHVKKSRPSNSSRWTPEWFPTISYQRR